MDWAFISRTFTNKKMESVRRNIHEELSLMTYNVKIYTFYAPFLKRVNMMTVNDLYGELNQIRQQL